MQSLFQHVEQLSQENQELRAQMAEGRRSQSRCTFPPQTNPNRSHSQMTRSSRRHAESSHHAHEEDFYSSRFLSQPEPTYPSINQSHPDEATSSTKGKRKRGQRWGFHLSKAMRARLGPEDKQAQAPPHISNTLKAYLGQSKQKTSPSFQPPQIELPAVAEPIGKAFLGSISRRSDDMLFTSFDPHIINYGL